MYMLCGEWPPRYIIEVEMIPNCGYKGLPQNRIHKYMCYSAKRVLEMQKTVVIPRKA